MPTLGKSTETVDGVQISELSSREGRRRFLGYAGLGATGLAAAALDGATGATVALAQAASTAEGELGVFDTVQELIELPSSSEITTAVVHGYHAPGDGGGGVFRLVPDDSSAGDEGLIMTPLEQSGRWHRLWDQSAISVRWFGATGDGATDDTAAIRAAASAIKDYTSGPGTLEFARGVSNTAYSRPALLFPAGHYVVWDTITLLGTSVTIAGDTRAVLDQRAEVPTLALNDVRRVSIRGLTFVGGLHHISLGNSNIANSLFTIEDCDFNHSSGACVRAAQPNPGVPPGDLHLSAHLSIRDCRFIAINPVVETYADITHFSDCWIKAMWDLPDDTAVFRNMSGHLKLSHVSMVPPDFDPAVLGRRWIDNYGSVDAEYTRFGGEGSGIPIIYHYAPNQFEWPWYGAGIVIRDCALFPGPNYPNGAVVNLVNHIPQTLLITGNRKVISCPYVKLLDSSSLDIASYLANRYAGYGADLSDAFKWEISPNQALLAGKPAVPSALMRFVRPEPPIFPDVPRTVSNVVVQGGRSEATWKLVIPPGLKSFTALVTFTANTNNGGSGAYMTTSTYLLSFMTAWNQSVKDYVRSQELFAPTFPAPATSTMTAYFDPATRSDERPHQSGGDLYVAFSHDTGGGMTYPTISFKLMQYIIHSG
ncbi:MAG: glycosyl hydrolase family 28-related protein [Myxococcales bacterium]|nr:glycosyl hydrolase family 28-related protein [Myxococcales bacterium]